MSSTFTSQAVRDESDSRCEFASEHLTPIVLPDSSFVQHVGRRLRREFPIADRARLELNEEAFNVLNLANLSGRSGNLLAPGFGQPTSRVTQVFGSGNPRSFPFAERKFLTARARSLFSSNGKAFGC